MKVKKVIIISVFIILFLGFIGYKVTTTISSIESGPHTLSERQVLEKFNWKMDSEVGKNVKFYNNHMVVDSKKYNYSLNDDNNVLNIKDGPYKGEYDLKMDTTDYILKNTNRNSEFNTIHLIRE